MKQKNHHYLEKAAEKLSINLHLVTNSNLIGI